MQKKDSSTRLFCRVFFRASGIDRESAGYILKVYGGNHGFEKRETFVDKREELVYYNDIENEQTFVD
jgi:hypothetical protein